MTQQRDNEQTLGAFAGLFDNSAATQAADRLYRTHNEGLRFCCNGERLTPEEARQRDARDAARRGQSPGVHETYADRFETSEPEFARQARIEDDDFDVDTDQDVDDNHVIDLGEPDMTVTDDIDLVDLELID